MQHDYYTNEHQNLNRISRITFEGRKIDLSKSLDIPFIKRTCNSPFHVQETNKGKKTQDLLGRACHAWKTREFQGLKFKGSIDYYLWLYGSESDSHWFETMNQRLESGASDQLNYCASQSKTRIISCIRNYKVSHPWSCAIDGDNATFHLHHLNGGYRNRCCVSKWKVR